MSVSRPDAVTGSRESELAEFVERLVAELAPLELEHNEAFWLANTTGDPRYEAESARLEAAMRKLFARREAYARLSRLRDAGPLADPLLDRELLLLHHAHRARQLAPEMIEQQVRLEKSLESRFNQFRAELDGQRVTDNQIVDLLEARKIGRASCRERV